MTVSVITGWNIISSCSVGKVVKWFWNNRRNIFPGPKATKMAPNQIFAIHQSWSKVPLCLLSLWKLPCLQGFMIYSSLFKSVSGPLQVLSVLWHWRTCWKKWLKMKCVKGRNRDTGGKIGLQSRTTKEVPRDLWGGAGGWMDGWMVNDDC